MKLRFLAVFALLTPAAVWAQGDVEALGRRFGTTPPPGYYEMIRDNPRAFQFEPSGWTRRGAAVAVERNRLRALGLSQQLSLEQVSAATAVTGDLNVPVLLVMYSNTDSAALQTFASRSVLESRLFTTSAAPPYSIHTYYKEQSNNLFSINGTVLDWVRLANNDAFYEGGSGCNGLCPSAQIAGLISEGVAALDPSVDFGMFDNDGPDNMPNSGDDDGFVDVLVVLHPEVDGACGTTNIWAHRFSYKGWTGDTLATADAAAGGGNIAVNNYVIQGGQGGDACTSNQPVAMGISAHELGHAINLPDLYDTQLVTQGIGEWGLMGAGNWQIPTRPVHMTAWTKADLGWLTEVVISSDTVLDISPIVDSDTSYVLSIQNTNEYFILANRQPILSDQSLTSGATPLGPGLLIWHVDSVLMAARRPSNLVNASFPHALSLEQADGLRGMENNFDRGEPGDAFPGSTNNSNFSFDTNPSSSRNDGIPSYVRVLDITQVVTDGAMRATISFQRPTVISMSHPGAVFRLDGNSFTDEALNFLDVGTTHSLDIDAVQTVDGGNRRYTFVSWSDGGSRAHDFVVSGAGDSILGQLSAEYLVTVVVAGNGTVTSPELTDPVAGEFVAEGTSFSLEAVPDPGNIFLSWSGDIASAADSIGIPDLSGPLAVNANFQGLLAVADASVPNGIMGADYDFTIVATGGNETFVWTIASGSLPQGLFLQATGTLVGVPAETGTFNVAATVRSDLQVLDVDITVTIVAPVLVSANVVRALLVTSSLLSLDERRFLDLLGNTNGSFDIGDFLAWVESGGDVTASVMAELLSTTVNAEGGER